MALGRKPYFQKLKKQKAMIYYNLKTTKEKFPS